MTYPNVSYCTCTSGGINPSCRHHGSPSYLLDQIDSLKLQIIRLEQGLKNLVEAVENNGYFEDWLPEKNFNIVVDGEIDKNVWWAAKEILSSSTTSKEKKS